MSTGVYGPLRENIMLALFTLVAKSAAYQITSRKIKVWTDVPQEDHPALFMVEHRESYRSNEMGGPPLKRYFMVDFYIYTWVKDDPSPISALNPLLDALDTALFPDNLMSMRQTLGGLVSNCWISGEITKVAGDLDGQGFAQVPITIVVP